MVSKKREAFIHFLHGNALKKKKKKNQIQLRDEEGREMLSSANLFARAVTVQK